MGSIGVIHSNLEIRGGAEAVCLHAIEALQNDGHDVTLYTLSDPAFDALNDHFDTSVRRPRVVEGRTAGWLNDNFGNKLSRLQMALLFRSVRHQFEQYDAILSTKNEFPIREPSVQYVHSPQFGSADPCTSEDSVKYRAYSQIVRNLFTFDPATIRSAKLLANSDWTKNALREIYGQDVDVTTVYPPVPSIGAESRPWPERENGFLSIGRIDPTKGILDNVSIIDRLRERGHDVHLHVVGPVTDSEYAERVERRAAERPHVILDGSVSKESLETLYTSHRYGLHGRKFEHFGIAVAELASAGAIPFAPNSGGQREILDEDDRVLYDSTEDAVEKIDRVLSSPDLQESLRTDLMTAADAYRPERFRDEIITEVEQILQ